MARLFSRCISPRELALWAVYCFLVLGLAGCCMGRPCEARYRDGRVDQLREMTREAEMAELRDCRAKRVDEERMRAWRDRKDDRAGMEEAAQRAVEQTNRECMPMTDWLLRNAK